MMNYDTNYKKFIKQLLKEKLAHDENKKLSTSDYVASVTKDGIVDECRLPRYTVKLNDETVYYVYEKPEKQGSFWDIFKK